MDFQLTKEQTEFQQEIREFAKKEIEPGAIERDAKEDFAPLHGLLIGKMGPMGLLGLTFPKEYGGQGRSHIDFALAMMEICKVDVSVGAAWSVSLSLGTIPIYQFATEEQKQRYLVPLCQGKCLPAFGLTEPNAGSDSAMQETTALRDGDDYILNGKKIYITNASYAETYIIMAMTDPARGTKGISAFIVEKDTPGLTFDNQYVKMGIRSTIQTEVIMKDCRVPAKNRIGEEGQGFKIAMTALDVGRLGVAAQGAGAAWGALNMAARYAQEREQFGKPIFHNQAISFMLADMGIQVELSRLILLKACWLKDQGLPFSKEAAMAKTYCTDAAMKVATDAVQIYGGKGFLRENQVERFVRDAKILQIYEGTNQVQRMIVSNFVAREARDE